MILPTSQSSTTLILTAKSTLWVVILRSAPIGLHFTPSSMPGRILETLTTPNGESKNIKQMYTSGQTGLTLTAMSMMLSLRHLSKIVTMSMSSRDLLGVLSPQLMTMAISVVTGLRSIGQGQWGLKILLPATALQFQLNHWQIAYPKLLSFWSEDSLRTHFSLLHILLLINQRYMQCTYILFNIFSLKLYP